MGIYLDLVRDILNEETMKFGLCLNCAYSASYVDNYKCSHPSIRVDSYSFPADFGCNHFKQSPFILKESVETLNNRKRIVELEKRLRNVESFVVRKL